MPRMIDSIDCCVDGHRPWPRIVTTEQGWRLASERVASGTWTMLGLWGDTGAVHMAMHSLTKSAIFFAVGHVAQVKGTQRIADMGGLTQSNPVLGWGLVLGVVAIAGLPPLGIFTSEFLVITSTFARAPWLASVMVFGSLVAFAALFLRLNSIAFGEPRGKSAKAEASYVPMFAHLALVFVAGIYLPASLVAWFQNVAKLLG